MSYSIFAETMADMTYPQIEKAAAEKQLVLFPIAVIEEHGPHLPTGTDTYLTYQFCKQVKQGLLDLGFHSTIVPPYYWGINVCTNGFAGSFTVKPATMVSVICDLLECLKTWGFERIFLFNLHGDLNHTMAIVETVRKAYEELNIGAFFVVPGFFSRIPELAERKPYLVLQPSKPRPSDKNRQPSKYVDIHAGGFETSLMLDDFAELVDVDLAKKLKSSRTTWEDLKTWRNGGATAREITPLGYCGDPSNLDTEGARIGQSEMTRAIAQVIGDFLKNNK